MARMRASFLLPSCFLFVVLMLNISCVNAFSQTFSVDAGQQEVRNVDLKVDDEVFGRISVIGGSSSDIDFYVTEPDGNVIVKHEKVSVKDFSFTVSKEGTHKLFFDNTFSTGAKTISFNYDVRHFIFGIPQEGFLVFVVVIVGVIGLALFTVLSRP